jgi:hypothetical protein
MLHGDRQQSLLACRGQSGLILERE